MYKMDIIKYRVSKVEIDKQKEKVLFHPELSFPTYLKIAVFHSCDFRPKSAVSELRYVPAVFPTASRVQTGGFPLDPPQHRTSSIDGAALLNSVLKLAAA